MARKRVSSRRPHRISSSQATEALRKALHEEFDDYVTTQSLPAQDDQRGRERYMKSLRRMVLSSPNVAVRGNDSISDTNTDGLSAIFGEHVMDMGLPSLLKRKFTAGMMSPIRLGDGLYDFYPPELPVKGFWQRKPFTTTFPPSGSPPFQKDSPPNSSLMLTVPQVGSGRFYASASTFQTPTDRVAKAWCGTMLPIDPNLHDEARGPKDVVVWAEGTIVYDYALSATLGSAWNTRPEAATAQVDIHARLLRFDRQTGQPTYPADANVLPFLAFSRILNASLFPNGVTTSPPSSPTPHVGGPYAAWSSGPTSFAIDLPNGTTRKLETDSTYQVAVVCSVQLSALSGPAPASAQVSAQLFLRLVTLGILPHDPSVPF
ncbi:MAG: hypothetical protein Q8S00_13880 [Deltaproteobacteria bacterium]|nr:hypothetical protein [Deltaproteobacteria bacterium]